MSMLLGKAIYYFGLLSTGWRSYKILRDYNLKQPHLHLKDDADLASPETQARILLKHSMDSKIKEILRQWTVLGVVYLYNYYVDPFFCFWMPFYDTLKCIFLLWLIIPELKGSSVVFDQLLKPQFQKHEVYIDDKLFPAFSSILRNIGSSVEDLVFASSSLKWLSNDELTHLKTVYESRIRQIEAESYQRGVNLNKMESSKESYFKKMCDKVASTPRISTEPKSTSYGSPETVGSENSQTSWLGTAVAGLVDYARNSPRSPFNNQNQVVSEEDEKEEEFLGGKYDTGFETLEAEFDEDEDIDIEDLLNSESESDLEVEVLSNQRESKNSRNKERMSLHKPRRSKRLQK